MAAALFPTLQKATPKANLLYSCYPALLTKNAPSQFGYGASTAAYYQRNGGPCPNDAAVVCWQRYTGTDPVTGFAYPTTSPIFAYNGGVQEGFGMYVIDQYFGLGNPGSQSGVDASTGIATESATVRGVPLTTLKANQYNHVQNGYQSGVQSHFMIFRNTSAGGFVDLTKTCIEMWMKIPDQSTLLSTTYKFRTIHDFKTIGDFRYGIQIIIADSTDAAAFGVAAGKLGWLFIADNAANGGLTQAEFIRVKNYSVPVPTDYYKASIYWNRSASFSDLTTGRFVYKILTNAGLESTVFDITPTFIAQYNIDHPLACTNQAVPSNCVNRHMGENSNPWQRLFLVSNYFGGVGGKDVQFNLAKLDIWDDAPFTLAALRSIT